ncbi:MAG: UDP-N-acetylmuramoylalanine--D-glutamate ligase [Bacteroidetes bacterium CG2_30_33_31]|nr:MAG: UDP-N-acetylmuramoylalanine--D-glutamate ligase [Bacteroidetes bacterium CG2_30_33_31]
MIYNDRNICILGAAISGIGAAVLAQKQGYHVFVSDSNSIKSADKLILKANEIEFEEDGHNFNRILKATEIIKSPGIPNSVDILKKAIQKGIPIISEIEFAARFTDAHKICITGSNGKTTTTLLIYHILKTAGKNVGLAGNVGKSFAMQVAEENYDYYVLEISSFQLDNMFQFKAETAILTNITPDHLDRYDYDFNKYIDSKFRITRNQTSSDIFIYNADDEVSTREIAKRNIKAKTFSFAINNDLIGDGAKANNKEIIFNINKSTFNMTLEQLALQGKHNIYNSMAGGITAKLEGIRKETIRACLNDIDQIEHRMESVGKVRGVQFINDSKATNVNSTWFALESINSRVIWIVGGVDKGNDYTSLIPLVKEKVKAIVCLGVDNSILRDVFEKYVDFMTETTIMNDAVEKAFYLGEPNDVVLLSPACASFDLFDNYEDRGKKFKRAVQDL